MRKIQEWEWEIWSEVVVMLKSQYDGKSGSDGAERQQLAFIQQQSSPFLESAGLHIRWNYGVPSGICI